MEQVTIPLYDLSGQSQGDLALEGSVFNVHANPELIQQAVTTALANRRAATAHTKDRSEVSGSGKKPWRQKGTGNARAGSIRSPLWRGGGVTFGPTNVRNYTKRLPQKMRQLALAMALSSKVKAHSVLALTSLEPLDGKTKSWITAFHALPPTSKSVLIIDATKHDLADRSIRNFPNHKYITIESLTLYDVMRYASLIISKEAAEQLTTRLKGLSTRRRAITVINTPQPTHATEVAVVAS